MQSSKGELLKLMTDVHSRNKKGFTLVELIVVIAIVAILAAVSIVGYQSYINKARTSNDITDARNMTGVLQAYMTLNGLEEVDPAEIRAIVNLENDYSFIPRVTGYSFWYSEATKTIEVKSSFDVMFDEGNFTELTGWTGIQTCLLSDNDRDLDAPPAVGQALEEVVNGHYLLDRGGSDLADAIMIIRNLRTIDQFNSVTAEGTGTLASAPEGRYSAIRSHLVADFNPDDTLFINDFFGLSTSDDEVAKVVFADGIEAIPGSALSGVTQLPSSVRIPVSVTVIETGAFTSLVSQTRMSFDSAERIRVESDAFHPADTLNSVLRAKEGSTNLYEIKMNTATVATTTSVYNQDGENDSFLGYYQTTTTYGQIEEASHIHFLNGHANGTSGSYALSEWNTYVANGDSWYDPSGTAPGNGDDFSYRVHGYFLKDDNYYYIYKSSSTVFGNLTEGGTTYGQDTFIPADYDIKIERENIEEELIDGLKALTLTVQSTEIRHDFYGLEYDDGDDGYLGYSILEFDQYYSNLENFIYFAYSGYSASDHMEFRNKHYPNQTADALIPDDHFEEGSLLIAPTLRYFDTTGTQIDSGTLYTTLSNLVSDNHFRLTATDTTLVIDANVYIKDTDTSVDVNLHALHVTYREDNGRYIAEVKAYDSRGNLVAKGIIITVKKITVVHHPSS